jgi:hypothetical protein
VIASACWVFEINLAAAGYGRLLPLYITNEVLAVHHIVCRGITSPNMTPKALAAHDHTADNLVSLWSEHAEKTLWTLESTQVEPIISSFQENESENVVR